MNSLRGKLIIKIGRHGKDVALQCKAANLKEKKHLRALYLGWTYESDDFDSNTEDVMVEELEGLQPRPNLKSLFIRNYGGGIFQSWLLSLTNLVELSLSICLPIFPSVEEELYLSNVSSQPLQQTMMTNQVGKAKRSTPTEIASSSTLVASPTPFSKLKCLSLYFIGYLETLPKWIDNCTSLVKLDIWGCRSLTSLPEGMRGLTSLQRLQIEYCFPILLKRCKRETGVDWPKISHIPEIDID